jgi:hypothetical protein
MRKTEKERTSFLLPLYAAPFLAGYLATLMVQDNLEFPAPSHTLHLTINDFDLRQPAVKESA